MESTSTMLRKAMTLLLAVMLTSVAAADTLIVDGISPDNPYQPGRGATKADVLAELGEPVNRVIAVGEPPISSWEYDGFVVYFEHDYVLHSVAKR